MKNFIKKVIELSKIQKSSKDISQFIEEFYSQNDLRDLASYSHDEMAQYAKKSFDFFQTRKSNEYKIDISDVNGDSISHSILNIINKDCPFLVDSLVSLIENSGYDILNIMHPIFSVDRDGSGKLKEFVTLNSSESRNIESVIQIHLKDKLDKKEKTKLQGDVLKTLTNISLIVDDWRKIIDQVHDSQNQILVKNPTQDLHEVKSFISWLVEKGFIFMGFIEFSYKKDRKGNYHLEESEDNPPLGVFRSKDEEFLPRVATNSTHEEISYAIDNPYIIEILKSSYKSRIHRFVNAERIRIQKFSHGKVIGEYRVIGLFTSSAYYQSPTQIPLIKNKINQVIQQSGYSERSHNHKDLLSVLKHYPRDELFQIETEDLLRIAKGIVMICGRNQIRLFARKDKFNRFINCLVFMPKDRSNSELRGKIRDHIAKFYNGSVADFYIEITESSLVRLQVIIKIDENNESKLEEARLEREIVSLAKPWSVSFKEELYKLHKNEDRKSLFKNYSNAFTVSYKNRFDCHDAAQDVMTIEESIANDQVKFLFSKSQKLDKDICELKIFSPNEELYLSTVMPILESFGLNVIHEHTYQITPKNRESSLMINYFKINIDDNFIANKELKSNFEEALSQAYQKNLGLGTLNKLLVSTSVNWRVIFAFKSYLKYLSQAGFTADQDFVAEVMLENIEVTKTLLKLFEVKFNPELYLDRDKRLKKVEKVSGDIRNQLSKITNASHDDAIRKFFNLVNATLRTNFYQKNSNGNFKEYISFKFDSKNIPFLPLPKPHAEIFVHSNKMEGVHLRGGKVARGGLRWSDRKVDYRTEVLGLVKAQMTKNAVIVPVGSKGGFVVKEDLSGLSREEFMNKGIECYKQFLRGILDLTDNIKSSKIIAPKEVVRYDEDDPYLVVAADKGTATFSDIANCVSDEYDFWLGDAFASGGSVGYDHKKMGITAKGAWVCVTRHFREMGINCQKDEFTCVGIGDMSGDVFGNGMLSSDATKLVAAFNHMHIFIDPTPDAKKSFKERKRLFSLPRSSWLDYDKKLISKGGGIFDRSSKSIKLNKQIKDLFNIAKDNLTPDELIQYILKSEVDLIWNGGIGTYVKSGSESNSEVGDRANDSLRVNGSDLKCKVIGEGGNLGFTQLGRIEYALNGGRVNTDSMDNSAGVDCSDHEVNIKIALAKAIEDKKISTKQRNKILESMTNEVSDLVLRDNYLQSQAVSNAINHGYQYSSVFASYIKRLESNNLIDREIEFLPSSKEIKKRQAEKIGFTRPEFCVMLSYAKMEIYQQLLSSDLLNDSYLEKDLLSYFPKKMQKDFSDEILSHGLRKEIIATQITNFIVDNTGIYFVGQIAQDTGHNISDVIKSILIAVESFGLRDIWTKISDTNWQVTHVTQAEMFHMVNKLMERSVLWLLKNDTKGSLSQIIARFKEIATELAEILPKVMAHDSKKSYEEKILDFTSKNVTDKGLISKVSSMDPVASAFDISKIASSCDQKINAISKIYFEVGTRFSLKWLRSQLTSIAIHNSWDRVSIKTITDDLYSYQMKISREIVAGYCKKSSCDLDEIENWISNCDFSIKRYDDFISEIRELPVTDLSVFFVILSRLKSIVTNN